MTVPIGSAGAPDRLCESGDFALTIAYEGPEDKPFYRARLVGRARSGEYAVEPFWGMAVIGSRELAALLAVLEAGGASWSTGARAAGREGYYVEMDARGETSHCRLGSAEESVSWLEALAQALDGANRKPVLDIAARLGLRRTGERDTTRDDPRP